MAVAHVQSATVAQGSGVSSTAPACNTLSSVAAGNCIIVVGTVGDFGGTGLTITSVTDGTNTYTVRTSVSTDGAQRVYAIVAYAVDVSAGNFTPQVNLGNTSGGSNRYFTLGAMEWSGVAISTPEDTWDAADDFEVSGADVAAGPITTGYAGALIVGACAMAMGSANLAFASPTSWTNRYRENDSNTYYGHDSGTWLPGTVQTSYSPAWSHANASGEGSAVVVSLKPAHVGPDGTAHVTGRQASASTWTLSGKTTAGTNRLGVVRLVFNSTRTISSVTWGGNAMTHLGTTVDQGTERIFAYYIIAPPTASSDVVVTLSGPTDGAYAVTSYEAVHQTTPTGAANTATGTSTTPSVDVSSEVGALVLDAMLVANTISSVGAGQTSEYLDTTGGSDRFGCSREAGATTVTMSWTVTSAAWATLGFEILPVESLGGGGGGGAAGPLMGGKLVGRGVLLGRLVA